MNLLLIYLLINDLFFNFIFQLIYHSIILKRFLNDINRNFEQSVKTLFDLSPDGFLVADLKGKILFVSQAGKKMFGIDDNDIAHGINLFDFVHNDDKEKALKNNADRLKGNYDGFSEYKVIRKDGTCFWNETNAVFIKDSKGVPRTLFVVFRDITNRKIHEAVLQKYTNSLQELNSIKDRFFSIIAHDLKNPFHGIMSFSELLLNELRNGNIEKSIEFASIINEISISGQELLTNLLDWVRLQSGKIKVNNQVLSFGEILDEQVKFISPMALEKEISIAVNYDKTINIFSDKDILGIIFRNLLNNAVKFTNCKGTIKINSISFNDKISVIIEDNGIGMSEDIRKNLFSLGELISSPGTKNEKGSGLGLILCKDFATIIGSQIIAESQLGIGSKFTLVLPRNKNI
jgi:two-component system, sensor histidine kinase and response regulator